MVKKILPVVGIATVLLFACDAEIVPPQLDDPFFYLILEPGGVWDGIGTFNHYAITATIARADEVRCRSVQSFGLRLVPDGTPFAARVDGARREIFGAPSIPSDACCTIPGTGTSDSLGALDLRSGQSYQMEVVTEGVVIRGSVTVPDSFGVSIVNDAGLTQFVWPWVSGAAGYEIALDFRDVIRQQDTSLVIESGYQGSVRVLALDPNLWSYLTDSEPRRSGIDFGLGVFGAISAAPRIEIR